MINDTLNILMDKPMIQIGRASDMLWIQFGQVVTVKNYRGICYEKGEYELHIQCPWRIIFDDKLILGSSDFYSINSDIQGDDVQWDTLGANVFDAKVVELKKHVLPIVVKSIKVDIIGSINIFFEEKFIIQVFPVCSTKGENWRFINNLTGEHMIFNEE